MSAAKVGDVVEDVLEVHSRDGVRLVTRKVRILAEANEAGMCRGEVIDAPRLAFGGMCWIRA